MLQEPAKPGNLQPKELEAVYAISSAVIRAVNTDDALDEIINLTRPVFIFDNIVLYQQRSDKNLEPIHARAIGRGRFLEADLAWGESTAYEAHQINQTLIRVEDLTDVINDRTGIRHYLGIPLRLGEEISGALVFIRFGGPPYLPDQIQLAEFITLHIAQLLERHQLVERIAILEARRRLDNLQDDFIAMISHELLTPLGFIKGYVTTLLREDTFWDEKSRREFLNIINDESDRLRELIDNLMDSSRLQAGTLEMNFQSVRLDTLLQDASVRARSRDENMKVYFNQPIKGLQISADATRLSQVLDNILGNASKYAPNSPIKITVERIDNKVSIVIKDRGPGIPSDHLEQIFQRFYRLPGNTNTSVCGSGLGLYICRKIIEAHNGEISAQSSLGQGTTFNIILPCEQPS